MECAHAGLIRIPNETEAESHFCDLTDATIRAPKQHRFECVITVFSLDNLHRLNIKTIHPPCKCGMIILSYGSVTIKLFLCQAFYFLKRKRFCLTHFSLDFPCRFSYNSRVRRTGNTRLVNGPWSGVIRSARLKSKN